ncbi:MAG TPA: GAF domain-containing protein [Candidatus Latescibacteria bacterium]|nr:GAF domain-containing protein [Candidatus Latescibacterota bacterium]
MSIYSLPSIIAFALNVALGLIVLSSNPKRTPNRLFALFAFSFATWNIGEFTIINSSSETMTLFGARVLLTGLFMFPVFFLHFTYIFPRRFSALLDHLRNRVIFYAIPIAVLVLSLTLLQVKVSPKGWSNLFYHSFRPLQPPSFYIPYLVLAFFLALYISWGVRNLFVSLKTTTLARERLQIKYLIFGVTSMIIAGVAVDLANYSLKLGLPLFSLSSLYTILLSLFFAIAVIRYRLLDIHILIRSGILYSSLSALMMVIYVLIIKNLGDLIGGATRSRSVLTESLFIILLVLLFQPLKNKVEMLIDRLFYRGKYEYQKKFMDFSEALIDIANLHELLRGIVNFVIQTLHTQRAALLLRDQGLNSFVPGYGENIPEEIGVDVDSHLAKSLRLSKRPMEYDDIRERMGADSPDVKLLKRIRASMVVPMMVKDELIAIFVLGEKSLKKRWTVEEINLLTILSNQASIAISRALMYEEVKAKERELMRSEKLAALGELSAGIAHEVRNPLGIISGSAETLKKKIDVKTRDELIQFIIDETRRLDGLLSNFLDFARPRRPNLQRCNLLEIAEDSVALISKRARDQGVTVEKDYDRNLPPLLLDPVQIKQVLINLELNALEAMKYNNEGTLGIGVKKGNGRVTIKVSDTGKGVSPEIQQKIYDPFFTTKENGIGLGLSIVHRIVESYGGTISLSSEEGKGTTFFVTLPLKNQR